MAVTARIDLDPSDLTGLDQPSAAKMLHAMQDAGCEAAIVVLYPGELAGDPSGDRRIDPVAVRLAATISELLNPSDIMLLEVLLVQADRWWPLGCDDADCCPPRDMNASRPHPCQPN